MSKLLCPIGLSVFTYILILPLNHHHLPTLPRSSQLLCTDDIIHYGMSLWEHIDLLRAINTSWEEKQQFLIRYQPAICAFCSLCRKHILTIEHKKEQLELLSLCEDLQNNFSDALCSLGNDTLFDKLYQELTDTVLVLEASISQSNNKSTLKIPDHIKKKPAFNHVCFKHISST